MGSWGTRYILVSSSFHLKWPLSGNCSELSTQSPPPQDGTGAMGELPVLEAWVQGGPVPKWVFDWRCGSHCCPLQECYLTVGLVMLLNTRQDALTLCAISAWLGPGASLCCLSALELSLALLHHDGLKSSSAFQLGSSMTSTPSQPLPGAGSPASSVSDCPSAEHKDLLHRSHYSQAKGATRERGPGPGPSLLSHVSPPSLC